MALVDKPSEGTITLLEKSTLHTETFLDRIVTD
jgi:hypothetical protein